MAGLGFKISFPVSSQDMLKSLSTDLVRAVIMLGAITLLCTPIINNNTKKKYYNIKKLQHGSFLTRPSTYDFINLNQDVLNL